MSVNLNSQEFDIGGHGELGVVPIDAPFEEYMGGVKIRVAKSIGQYLDGVLPGLENILDYALNSERAGRIRPALTYMTGDSFNIPRDELDGVALASDLIHTASLAMDDLPSQDNSDFRRGRPTLHRRFSIAQADLAVVAMLADAAKIIGETEKKQNISTGISSNIWDLVGSRGMVAGQLMDLESFGRSPEDMTVEELDKITLLKTVTAVRLGPMVAATVGNLPEEVRNILDKYSYHAGIAYQAKDDLRDTTETSERLGKTAGIDAENEKPTYIDVLGEEGVKHKIAGHVEAANEALDKLPAEYNPVKFREILAYFSTK